MPRRISEAHAAAQHKARVLADLALDPWGAPRWLRGADRQTLWGGLVRRPRSPPLRLERWTTPDDDFVRVHLYDGDAGAPLIVITHGLEGDVRASYVRALAGAARALGWGVVAWEHRSCGGEMNRARRLYHMGETSDLGFVVQRTIERFPRRPLCLVGISLGANQVGLYLGQRCDDVPDAIHAAALVSAPFDLPSSAPHIEHALGGIYRLNFLRTLVPKALRKERQYPGCIDRRAVRKAWTLEAFDNHATAVLHGFASARDYWARTSCGPLLEHVRVPTLLLSANDDPFNPKETFPHDVARRSPWLHPLLTEGGGHVGFVTGTPWRERDWGTAQVMRFLLTTVRDYATAPMAVTS